MDAGVTAPRMEPVEPSREQRPRARHGTIAENENPTILKYALSL